MGRNPRLFLLYDNSRIPKLTRSTTESLNILGSQVLYSVDLCLYSVAAYNLVHVFEHRFWVSSLSCALGESIDYVISSDLMLLYCAYICQETPVIGDSYA